MKKPKPPARPAKNESRSVEGEPAFASVVQAFTRDRRVTFGGQGFGSRALRLNGKIFAMLSMRNDFVVKLPRERVLELIDGGRAKYFDTGRDRVMKEWVAILDTPAFWLELAWEAHRFAVASEAQRGRRRTTR